MRLLRLMAGVLVWLLASVLGLVAIILCVTIILLPVGVPLLLLARRLFVKAVQLLLPREVAHPVRAVADSVGSGRRAFRAASHRARQRAGRGVSSGRNGLGSRPGKAVRRSAKRAKKRKRSFDKRLNHAIWS